MTQRVSGSEAADLVKSLLFPNVERHPDGHFRV